MLERIYVEIGNICNLACSFCPGTKRPPRQMTEREFERICSESAGRAKFIYLHVMGEPLLHPKLDELLSIAGKYGLKVCITTNGTLVKETMKTLLSHSGALHKISVSLHAPEGNGMTDSLEEYLEPITRLAKEAAELGIYTVFRLWNEDSEVAVGSSSAAKWILKTGYPVSAAPGQHR